MSVDANAVREKSEDQLLTVPMGNGSTTGAIQRKSDFLHFILQPPFNSRLALLPKELRADLCSYVITCFLTSDTCQWKKIRSLIVPYYSSSLEFSLPSHASFHFGVVRSSPERLAPLDDSRFLCYHPYAPWRFAIFDLATGKHIPLPVPFSTVAGFQIAMANNGIHLIGHYHSVDVITISCWQLKTGKVVDTFTVHLQHHAGVYLNVELLPWLLQQAGAVLAICNEMTCTIHFINLSERRLLDDEKKFLFPPQPTHVQLKAALLKQTQQKLVGIVRATDVHLWDFDTGQCIFVHTGRNLGMAICAEAGAFVISHDETQPWQLHVTRVPLSGGSSLQTVLQQQWTLKNCCYGWHATDSELVLLDSNGCSVHCYDLRVSDIASQVRTVVFPQPVYISSANTFHWLHFCSVNAIPLLAYLGIYHHPQQQVFIVDWNRGRVLRHKLFLSKYRCEAVLLHRDRLIMLSTAKDHTQSHMELYRLA